MATGIAIRDARLGVRTVPTRQPVCHGTMGLTALAQIHLFLTVETADGRRATGVAADVLVPSWFDGSRVRTYADGLRGLAAGARTAAEIAAASARQPRTVYRIWRDTYEASLALGGDRKMSALAAGLGPSLVERALLDGLGLALDVPYHGLLRHNLAGIDLGDIHPELAGVDPASAIADRPLGQLSMNHTVGLADPVLDADIAPDERLDDGLPQSLEEYATRLGIRHFKVEVGGDVEDDAERLARIGVALKAVDGLCLSLDGDERYDDLADLVHLLDRLEGGDVAAQRLYASITYLEQPLDRAVALDPTAAGDIAALSKRKPVVIDESDDSLGTFKRAVDLGYRGVSSKACKGLTKALANQALCRQLNEQAGETGPRGRYFLTGADLTSIPAVSLHQNLAHLAALGIGPAEYSGLHDVRGLDHLPETERRACRERHATLYEDLTPELTALLVRDGRICLESVHTPGMGVGVRVDPATTTPLAEWRPEDLGVAVDA